MKGGKARSKLSSPSMSKSSLQQRILTLKLNTGGPHLSQIFWEHENLSGLSVIWLISMISVLIYIKLYKYDFGKTSGLSGNPA